MLASTSFGRRMFETIGGKLAQLNHSDTLQSKNLTDINIDTIQAELKNNKNVFHEHIPTLSKKVLGKTPIGRYSKLMSNIVPKSSIEKVTDTVFLQIGKLAQNWANFDLSHDNRFTGVSLDASERKALAYNISNQNRSLATLGGISNLAGLPGILVDTLWLLTVSLRSIFQIAIIYDRPLTGQQGIAIAYEILSKVDLNKLQEKQTLLAGLGIVEAIADNDLEDYKSKNLDENDPMHNSAALVVLRKIEELSQNFNINLANFNFNFLHKLLPLTAVGLGTTYNNIIINEVIQIAMTTFAPVPKLTQLKDKANTTS